MLFLPFQKEIFQRAASTIQFAPHCPHHSHVRLCLWQIRYCQQVGSLARAPGAQAKTLAGLRRQTVSAEHSTGNILVYDCVIFNLDRFCGQLPPGGVPGAPSAPPIKNRECTLGQAVPTGGSSLSGPNHDQKPLCRWLACFCDVPPRSSPL